MRWPQLDEALKQQGLLYSHPAVLEVASYQLPHTWRESVCYVKALHNDDDLSIKEIAWGLRNCIDRGWVALTSEHSITRTVDGKAITVGIPKEKIEITGKGRKVLEAFYINLEKT